jgi:hypothetical protein
LEGKDGRESGMLVGSLFYNDFQKLGYVAMKQGRKENVEGKGRCPQWG